MGKYKNDAQELLKYIGGVENIQNVSHCVTRMRFVLYDVNIANIKAIENIPSTKGTFTQSGQFQVIIGNEVSLFYQDFIEISGFSQDIQPESTEEASSQQNALQKIMSGIGEIFAPLIPALICGGFILGLSYYIDTLTLFENGSKTLVQISPLWQQINDLLKLMGETVFQYLPIAIIWSITKKMKTTQILGIILGITLTSPQLLSILNFHFLSSHVQYQGQILPAVIAGFLLAYLEKFWRKITPESINIIIVPLLSLVPAFFITILFAGPVGYVIGDYLAHFFWYCFTFSFNWLVAGILGLVYALLVTTGLHHFTIAIDIQLASSFGGTLLWPVLALSNIAQASSVLAMAVLQRKNKKAKKIAVPACISCYLGVSEPAMFGVNLRYKFPFVCALIGSAVAGMISVYHQTTAASIGVGGIPGILSILPQSLIPFILAMIAAITIPFVLTLIIGYKKLSPEDKYGVFPKQTEETLHLFHSPVEGQIVLLDDVEDQVFSQKLMGDGFAVKLTNHQIISPFDGEVVMTFPTKHAYGLKRSDGLEVLIHIGMDTVALNGEGFECFVEKGDHVQQGELIAKVNLDYIKKMNKSLVSPVIITSNHQIELLKTGKVALNENILKIAGGDEHV